MKLSTWAGTTIAGLYWVACLRWVRGFADLVSSLRLCDLINGRTDPRVLVYVERLEKGSVPRPNATSYIVAVGSAVIAGPDWPGWLQGARGTQDQSRSQR